MLKRSMWQVISIVLLIIGEVRSSIAQNPEYIELSIAATPHNMSQYRELIKTKPCYQVTLPEEHELPRGTLEMLLICRAIYAHGLVPKVTLINAPSYARALRMVMDGRADIGGETVWQEDIDLDKLNATTAVIAYEEYEKGLYTFANHPIQNMRPNRQQLAQLRGVVVKDWQVDLRTMKYIVAEPFVAARFISVFEILKSKRADFTLLKFPSRKQLDVWHTDNKYHLKPIRGFKVRLAGRRHYVVSKVRPNSKRIYTLLNEGIAQLRASGEIDQYLQSLGLRNPEVKDWLVLNPGGSGREFK